MNRTYRSAAWLAALAVAILIGVAGAPHAAVAQTKPQPQATGLTQTVIAVPVAVTGASAYATGNEVGPLLTFTGAARSLTQSGTIQKVVLQFTSNQTGAPNYDLLLFDSNPTNTTFTDKAAFSLGAQDIGKWIGTVHITDCTAGGTPSTCQSVSPPVAFTTRTAGTLYGVLVTRSAPTYASGEVPTAVAQISQD